MPHDVAARFQSSTPRVLHRHQELEVCLSEDDHLESVSVTSGKYYVQRRTIIKDYCPGMLDPMTGGVVQYGEPMDVSAEREAQEEMGVNNTPLRYLTTFYYGDDHSRVWGGLFDCIFDGPLVLQEDEVDEVLTMTANEILARRKEFTPYGMFAFDKCLKIIGEEEIERQK